MRFEARGLPVVFHWHDDVVCEVPEGAITEAEFLAILLEPPSWAGGLPLAGSVHSGPHYLPASDEPTVSTVKAPPVEMPDPRDGGRRCRSRIRSSRRSTSSWSPNRPRSPTRRRSCGPSSADDAAGRARQPRGARGAALRDRLARERRAAAQRSSVRSTTTAIRRACSTPIIPLFRLRRPRLAHGLAGRGRGHDPGRGGALYPRLGRRAPSAPVDDQKTANSERALALWNGGKPIAGTLAERYLAETRKIAVDKLPAEIADSLRFYDQCPYGKGVKHPCLIALMTDPAGAPCGIHRIALAEVDGKVDKIGRMALGPMGTVRLWPANGRLVVGEGIETTLAAATRIPYRGQPLTPAWAAVSDGGIKQLPLIDGVSELILLVDHDRNGAGQNAAMACERRWRQAGREVLQLMPNEPGWDFNDVVMRRSRMSEDKRRRLRRRLQRDQACSQTTVAVRQPACGWKTSGPTRRPDSTSTSRATHCASPPSSTRTFRRSRCWTRTDSRLRRAGKLVTMPTERACSIAPNASTN